MKKTTRRLELTAITVHRLDAIRGGLMACPSTQTLEDCKTCGASCGGTCASCGQSCQSCG